MCCWDSELQADAGSTADAASSHTVLRLPAALRIGSLVSILIYAVFAIIVLERAGLIAVLPSPDIARMGIWVIAGYLALGIVMNAISRSPPERFVMTPVAIALCGASGIVALGA